MSWTKSVVFWRGWLDNERFGLSAHLDETLDWELFYKASLATTTSNE